MTIQNLSAAENIARLMGDANKSTQVRNLLDEVNNGDEEHSQVASDALRELPYVSTELLATLQVAIRLDKMSNNLSNIQRQHNEIHGVHGKGCASLRIETERLQKMFFRGVCICLGLPLLLWIIMILGEQYLIEKRMDGWQRNMMEDSIQKPKKSSELG